MALIGEMQYLTIGGNTYSIPTSGGSTVTIERALTSGTKSATISVDGTSYDLYAPTNTDTKLQIEAVSTNTTYYPIIGSGTTAAIRQYDSEFNYIHKTNNDEAVLSIGSTIRGKLQLRDITGGIITLYSQGAEIDSSINLMTLETVVNTISTSAGAHTAISYNSGAVSFNVPTKTSHLTNDSGFITTPNVIYCTCDTAAATAAKVATVVSGSLASLNAGDQAIVKFTNANGVASPTLQIGSLTAKSIKRYGTTAPSTSATTSWQAGSCILFVYDGTYWQMCDWTNTNTTYSALSEADMQAGTATTARLITAARLKEAVEYHAPVTSVNGTTGAVTISVPTKTSDLTNDSGYITSYTDYRVKQTNITTGTGYPVLLGYQVGNVETTNQVYKSFSNFTFSPETGNLSATKFNEYVLAAACAKGVDTSISAGSSSTKLPTSAAVASFVEGKGYITSYTDEKVKAVSVTNDGNMRYLIFGGNSGNAETKYYHSGLAYSVSSTNQSTLTLGDGTYKGVLKLGRGGGNSFYANIDAGTPTASRTITLPDKDGTVALTSDVPTKTSDLTNDSGFVTTDEKLKTEAQTAYEAYYPILGDSSTTASTKFYSPYHRFHYDSSWAYLQVGDNNRTGNLRLARGNYSNSLFTESLTANRQIKFPNKDGTVALTSDIPTVTDEKLKTYSNYGTSGDVYYLVFGNNTNNAETKYHSTGLAYLEYLVDTDHFARLELGKEGLNGKLSIHDGSNNAYRAVTIESTTLTQQRSLTLPDKSGTVALTSDIPSVPSWALQSTKPTYTASEVGAMSTSHPANGITSANITTWNSIVSDDHKWNDVSLTHGLNASGNDFYVPGIGTVDGTAANLNRVTNTPMNYAIAKYGTGAYLYSTTPSANDNSTKVATTAYVDAAIPTSTATPTASTAAAFDSSAHMNSTDMTSTEITNFVNDLNVSNINAVDYVVEEGAPSQGSYYRKWNSGKAEYWYRIYNSSGATTSVWTTPIYYADYNSWSTIWQGIFNVSPTQVITSSNHSQFISIMPTAWDVNGVTSMRFVSVGARSSSPYGFSLYALGTWK